MRPISAGLALAVVLLHGSASIAETPAPDAPPRGGSRASASGAVSEAATYQPTSELDYVPITPCRAFDTSKAAILKKGKTGTFRVAGTTGFPAQGGPEGGCAVPSYAQAVALTLTGSGSTAAGTATAFSGSARPPIVSLSVAAKQSATAGSTVQLAADGTARVYVTQDMNVVGDVSGYFVKPMAAMVSDAGSLYSGSSRAINSARTNTGIYEVQFDRNIRYCAANASVYSTNYFASTTTWFDSSRPDTLQVRLWTNAGVAANGYFYVIVRC